MRFDQIKRLLSPPKELKSEFVHGHYGHSVRFEMPDNFFVPQLKEIAREHQHEMELAMSISLKRGFFGEGTGEPLTPEEEAYDRYAKARREDESRYCPECGRPWD